MYTGQLGTFDAQPGNIILGGQGPAEGGEIDVDATSTLALVSEADTSTIDVEAESTIAATDAASTTVPWHVEAESTIAATVATTSNIKMLSASSPISLTSTAVSTTFEVSASSPISLVSAARSTTLDVSAVSALSITDEARPGLIKKSLTDTIVPTQEAVCVGGTRSFAASSALAMTATASTTAPRHKSASSPIALTQAALGEGPVSASASNALELTDAARSGIWMVDAASIITFFDVAYEGQDYIVDASSAIALTDTAVGFNLHVYAESPISLVSAAENTEKFRDAESAISLTSTAAAEVIRSATSVITLTDLAVCNNVGKQAVSELELTDEARNTNIRILAEASFIEFTQEATSNIKMLSVEDIIGITDSLNVLRPWYATAESELTTVELVFDLDTFSFIEVVTGLTQEATYQLIAIKAASNIISFFQGAIGSHVRVDGIDCEAESTIGLAHQAWNSKTGFAINTSLSAMTSTATAELSNAQAESELDSLDVAADFIITRNQSATNALEVTQAVAFILERANTRCTYSPFVGGTSDPNAPTPPPVTYPAAGVTSGFRLQYPSTGPVTDELSLRVPNLGNLDRLAMTRINRETRGGTLIVYADPIWPKVETLVLSFSGLSNTQAQALLTFMDDYLGQEIRLIDWEDRVWVGVITNPSDPIVQDGRGCQMAASFEFEGTKV